jgi:ankyrin repeat protein
MTGALVVAAMQGNAGKVRKLLQGGADVNYTCVMTGETALWNAALKGEAKILKILIDAAADVNRPIIVESRRCSWLRKMAIS